MPDWLARALVVGTVGGVFVLFYYLIVKRQAGDPTSRGQDSSEPPDFVP
jgi:hypothetical protein